jgi:NAD(P)-dependent dehydrogenase (short-subunit alcohol dehydrogenase family)
MSLNGKVCIVTGASAGIGRAYTLALAAEGATVIAAARTAGVPADASAQPTGLAEVVQAGVGLPGAVHAKVCDVESEADIVRLIDEVVAEHRRIDVLVNNAGIYTHYDSLGISSADWDRYVRVNLRGPWLTMKYAAPHMVRQGGGSIVNMTSAVAVTSSAAVPSGHHDLMHYAVTKAALNRMSTHLSEDMRPHRVAVNALSPGFVLTDTYVSVDPVASAAAREDGRGKPPAPEVMGPPLIYLAQLCEPEPDQVFVTGQVLHHDQFRKSWPAVSD